MPVVGLQAVYAAGDCEIDVASREFRVSGSPVPIGGRAFDIIKVLAEAAGELVTKDALMERVWPGAIVNDNALQVHVSALRKALGVNGAMLRTESGRGYRLLGGWTVRSRDMQPAVTAPVVPARRAEGAPATNLPVAVTPLIGRAAAARELRDLVSAYRLVTLTGPGGIGKTALARQVGRDLLTEFADGTWFVELASLSDPALVPSAVASGLGLTLGGDTISSVTVAGAIGRQHLLLILDNCEHVIAAVADLVETIMRACPNITLLATSREIVRVEGERVYRVPPLDVPTSEVGPEILGHSAVELFVARANALVSDYSVDAGSLPLIAAICHRLDGIPLAIEFAAARMATLGIEHVANGLNDRFALLTSGRRTALPRHRTLRAVLDWSYDLLAEEERALLCRLAIFPAGFTVAAAVALGGEAGAGVVDTIAALIQKSLVAVEASETGSRWRLLETTRSYALEKLAERGDADETARRHAAYFRDFSAPIATDFGSRASTVDVAAYVREIDNVRAALDWSFSSSGDASIGVELAAAYAPIWSSLSLMAECRAQCERALHRLEATRQSDAPLRMRLQIGLGSALLHTLGPSREAETIVTEALATASGVGDLDAQARALSVLSGVHAYRGEYALALTEAERVREIADRMGDSYTAVVAHRRMGIRFMTLGRLVDARHSLERTVQSPLLQETDRLPLWRQAADRALARASLARVLWLQGFAERARDEAHLSLDESRGTPDRLAICRVLYYGVGRVAPMTGDFATADSAIAQLNELAMTLNAPFWITAGQFLRGKLLVERGDFAEGLAQLRGAFETCEQTGWRLSYPEFMGSLALALAGLGQPVEAREAIDGALAAAGGREDGQQWYVPELLRIKAQMLLRRSTDETVLAEDCLEHAAALAREQGALTWELRIARTSAGLRAAQGRRDAARQILAPVYQRFTEGFETADLQAARALLDTISP